MTIYTYNILHVIYIFIYFIIKQKVLFSLKESIIIKQKGLISLKENIIITEKVLFSLKESLVSS